MLITTDEGKDNSRGSPTSEWVVHSAGTETGTEQVDDEDVLPAYQRVAPRALEELSPRYEPGAQGGAYTPHAIYPN